LRAGRVRPDLDTISALRRGLCGAQARVTRPDLTGILRAW